MSWCAYCNQAVGHSPRCSLDAWVSLKKKLVYIEVDGSQLRHD